LAAKGIATATLHSNRSQNQAAEGARISSQGAVRVMVATDIGRRGIDVDGISHVVNSIYRCKCEMTYRIAAPAGAWGRRHLFLYPGRHGECARWAIHRTRHRAEEGGG